MRTAKQVKEELEKAEDLLEAKIEQFMDGKSAPETYEDFQEFWNRKEEFIEPFAEKVGELNQEYRLLKAPEMKDLDNIGDHMTFEDFKGCVDCGGFIDYDGYGYYATEIQQSDIVIYPSDVREGKHRKDFTHVMWYNR